MSGANPNAEAIEAWNTVLFEKFLRFRHLVTEGLRIHGEAVMDRLAPGPDERVIDLGCGFGDTTVELARRGATAVGVDCAERFIELADREAREGGLRNIDYAIKDVQKDDLGGPYDVAFSRFGMMFFANPVAALRNVGRALASGGRFGMVVWRRRDENPWLYDAETAVRELVEAPEDSTAVTCGPGPFSMADAGVVTGMLESAGYERIALERHDADICIGRDLDEAIAIAMALGPAGEIIRLAGEAAERRRDDIDRSLRDALARYLSGRGVWAPSSTWLVTATAPGG